jgi:lysophospholipase L1-like esterase
MSRASVARRIAQSAAYGGGSLVGVGVGTYGLLRFEAIIARRRVGPVTGEPFEVDGWYGPSGPVPFTLDVTPVRLLMLGDSAAAGLGADEPKDTPAVVVATGLAAASGRPVELRCIAVVGALTSDLDGQLDRLEQAAPEWRPDVAVMMVGANDATRAVRPAISVRHLDQVLRRLREGGAEVVLGTCPDLGTVRPIPHPLRRLGQTWSRRLAAAQTIAVVEAGGRSVSLADLLGPEFHTSPGEYFSADQFHPSSLGYRRCGEVLLPSAAAALGLVTEPPAEPGQAPTIEEVEPTTPVVGRHRRRKGVDQVLPVAEAAAAAADEPGTEVAGTQVAGQDRSREGRWAAIRRRLPLLNAPGPAVAAELPDIQDSSERAEVG